MWLKHWRSVNKTFENNYSIIGMDVISGFFLQKLHRFLVKYIFLMYLGEQKSWKAYHA